MKEYHLIGLTSWWKSIIVPIFQHKIALSLRNPLDCTVQSVDQFSWLIGSASKLVKLSFIRSRLAWLVSDFLPIFGVIWSFHWKWGWECNTRIPFDISCALMKEHRFQVLRLGNCCLCEFVLDPTNYFRLL